MTTIGRSGKENLFQQTFETIIVHFDCPRFRGRSTHDFVHVTCSFNAFSNIFKRCRNITINCLFDYAPRKHTESCKIGQTRSLSNNRPIRRSPSFEHFGIEDRVNIILLRTCLNLGYIYIIYIRRHDDNSIQAGI